MIKASKFDEFHVAPSNSWRRKVRRHNFKQMRNEATQKSNLPHTRGVTSKRVTSGGTHLLSLAGPHLVGPVSVYIWATFRREPFGRGGIWARGHLGAVPFGRGGIWAQRHLGAGAFGRSAVWARGHLGAKYVRIYFALVF